jgi:hypothetical protein
MDTESLLPIVTKRAEITHRSMSPMEGMMRIAPLSMILGISVLLLFGAASNAQTPPPPVTCNVDLNNQTLLTWDVPQAAYSMQVVPAIQQIAMIHSQALTTYKIPFETFWQLTGLNLLFPNPPRACCPLCPTAPCVPDVQFRKTLNAPDPSVAQFSWSPTTVLPPFHNTVNEIQGDLQLKRFEGIASISAMTIILQFNSGLPTLTLTDLNYMQTGVKTITFDGAIVCFGSLAQWGVMRQKQPGSTIPNLDLFVNPQ